MKRKILAAFFLTLIAIALALVFAHFSFREMMGTVENLSSPNEKLIRLNRVFEEITVLDQEQRAESIRNPLKPYKYFLDRSGYLKLMIDSLQMLPWDSVQMDRLSSLSGILDERNQIFVSYMKVKAELADNKEFSQQLDTLSALLRESQRSTDSIVTTQRKTITHYVQQDSLKTAEKDRGFLKKIFGKKKDKQEAKAPPVAIREQLDVIVDTISIAHNTLDIESIQRRIREIESDRRSQRRMLQEKELELIHANGLFINQLLNTLHEVENEELRNIRIANEQAARVVNHGISRMNILMLTFFLATALLVYFILVDISKSNYYRKQLEKARDHAEELSKIKQRFLANMSHEIRTPLQSIIGFAEQLRQDKKRDSEAVDAIHSSSEHLLHIVNEVLDYSRITSGSLTLSSEPFRLFDVIREVESAIRIQAQRKRLTFILDTEKASSHQLVGDAFRLRQILYNLLGNAIKFTESGFVRLSVRTLEKDGRIECVFEIKDSGIGMSREEVTRIFNQFEQASPDISKKYGGTGLGLSIVKSLVEVQQGSLEVESTPGHGSTFTITLRYDRYESGRLPTIPGRTESTDPATLRVLVVDDDAMILRLCSLILTKNAIQHVPFNDAEALLREKPAVDITHILIDIRMPGINGIELCQALKSRYPRTTKFIALTAHVLPEERESVLTAGFDHVLTKPFHESDLLAALGTKPSPSKTVKIPDLSILRKMTMGDEELFHTILHQFVEESSGDLRVLRACMLKKDSGTTREIVHKMAGRFGQIGFTMIGKRFHEVELALVKRASYETIAGELSSLIGESEELLEQLSGELEKKTLNS